MLGECASKEANSSDAGADAQRDIDSIPVAVGVVKVRSNSFGGRYGTNQSHDSD